MTKQDQQKGMPHVHPKLVCEPQRIGYKHYWALRGVSLNCFFSLASFPSAAAWFQRATVSRRIGYGRVHKVTLRVRRKRLPRALFITIL